MGTNIGTNWIGEVLGILQYAGISSCDTMLSTAFLRIRYMRINNSEKGERAPKYVVMAIPTAIYHICKVGISAYLGKKDVEHINTFFISAALSLLLLLHSTLEGLFIAKNFFVVIAIISLMNVMTCFFIREHDAFSEKLIRGKIDNFSNRIRRIIREEIPPFIFANCLNSIEKNGYEQRELTARVNLFPVPFILCSFVSAIIILIDNTFGAKVIPECKLEGYEDSADTVTSTQKAVLFTYKVVCGVSETLLCICLAKTLNKYYHIAFIFSIQSILKLGYVRVQGRLVFFLLVIKVSILALMLLAAICMSSLYVSILFAFVFVLNGITSQIGFATFDHYITSRATEGATELAMFFLVTMCVVIFDFTSKISSADLVFMSCVRL